MLPSGHDCAQSRRGQGDSGLSAKPGGCLSLVLLCTPPQFDGLAKEEIQQVAADFCSYQSIALELIKTKQRKETRFQIFMQVCPSPGQFLALVLPWLPQVPPRGFRPLPSALGSRKQSAVPAPAAEGLDHLRNAAPDQVPAAVGEHHQAHRG